MEIGEVTGGSGDRNPEGELRENGRAAGVPRRLHVRPARPWEDNGALRASQTRPEEYSKQG